MAKLRCVCCIHRSEHSHGNKNEEWTREDDLHEQEDVYVELHGKEEKSLEPEKYKSRLIYL